MSHKWYAIQTYAGSEMAVKRGIENLVKRSRNRGSTKRSYSSYRRRN